MRRFVFSPYQPLPRIFFFHSVSPLRPPFYTSSVRPKHSYCRLPLKSVPPLAWTEKSGLPACSPPLDGGFKSAKPQVVALLLTCCDFSGVCHRLRPYPLSAFRRERAFLSPHCRLCDPHRRPDSSDKYQYFFIILLPPHLYKEFFHPLWRGVLKIFLKFFLFSLIPQSKSPPRFFGMKKEPGSADYTSPVEVLSACRAPLTFSWSLTP